MRRILFLSSSSTQAPASPFASPSPKRIMVITRHWASRPHRHTASPSTKSSQIYSHKNAFNGWRAAEGSKSQVTKQCHGTRKLKQELHPLLPCRASVLSCERALKLSPPTAQGGAKRALSNRFRTTYSLIKSISRALRCAKEDQRDSPTTLIH